jgi:hypothetical protein
MLARNFQILQEAPEVDQVSTHGDQPLKCLLQAFDPKVKENWARKQVLEDLKTMSQIQGKVFFGPFVRDLIVQGKDVEKIDMWCRTQNNLEFVEMMLGDKCCWKYDRETTTVYVENDRVIFAYPLNIVVSPTFPGAHIDVNCLTWNGYSIQAEKNSGNWKLFQILRSISMKTAHVLSPEHGTESLRQKGWTINIQEHPHSE